jgi:hypothetical protein
MLYVLYMINLLPLLTLDRSLLLHSSLSLSPVRYLNTSRLTIRFLHDAVKPYLDYHLIDLYADPKRLTEFLKRFIVGIFLYNFTLTCSKLSIALQYRRIFTAGKTLTALWFVIAIIIISCIWPFLTTLFFCSPMRKFWEPTVEGHCLDKKGVWFSYAGANIATSSILLLLPLPAILRLQTQTKTKVALVLIFSLGVL